MAQATRQSTTSPARPRNRAAAAAAKPAAKAPEFVDVFLGEEHWVAAAVPAADQMIILANRDRAQLGRMLAAWAAR